MSSKLDMTAMYAMHNALRRELEHLARITANSNDDPRQILRTAAGWELFKRALHIHHTSEDDALWPAMRQALANRPDDLALLDAMEYVIALCVKVREICPEFPGGPQPIHWTIPDSAAEGTGHASYPAFRRVAADLHTHIGFFTPASPHSQGGITRHDQGRRQRGHRPLHCRRRPSCHRLLHDPPRL